MPETPNEHNEPKIVDIFSKPDKQPRLVSEDPLDLEAQAQPDADTAIVGEKTAATMQATLLMDGSDDADAVTEAQENKIVTLTPEYDADTQFAGEVLDKLDTFQDPSEIRTYHTIDIRLEETKQPEPPEPPEPPQEDRQAAHIVAKVPVYRPDEPANLLNVKAGKFSEVVGREYEAYLRSNDPVISAHVRRRSPQAAQPAAPAAPQETTQEKILGAVVGFFSKEDAPKEAPQKQKPKPVEDYSSEEDEKSIRFELSESMRKLFFRTVISGVIALVAIAISVITRILPEALIAAIPVAPAAYAVFNFLLVGSSMVLNRVSMTGGLTPLLKLKGNSDTAVAVASCAALIQTIVAFFLTLGDMSHFSVQYYCSIVLLALFANNLGKLFLVRRVRENFSFLTAKGQKYAAKIYNNESVAHKMLSGTLSEKNLIAYQHKTKFAANFLKISYAPDPSEDLASRLAPVTTIATLAVTLLYGLLKGSAAGAVNTFALLTALSVPIATLLAVNVPVRKLCHTVNGYGAMIAGFPSIKQFCDSTAIMIDAEELFPADSIELEGIKTFVEYRVDESLLCGIAILKEAHNPIANAFESVVSEAKQTLPEVESVLYEDGLGLVGWVNSERILVGSRRLLEKYQVRIPVLPQCGIVGLGTVALMDLKTVLRILFRHLQHHIVTADFGKNGSCRNIGAAAVTLDNRHNRDAKVLLPIAVDQCEFSLSLQLINGTLHGKKCSLEDIHLIDLRLRGKTDSVSYRLFFDHGKQLPATLVGKFLAVVQAGKFYMFRQDHGCGTNMPCQRTSACLVHAADAGDSLGIESIFNFPHIHFSHDLPPPASPG